MIMIMMKTLRGFAFATAIAATALLAACGPAAEKTAYYEPAPEKLAFDFNAETSFSRYMQSHIAHVRKHRVYVDPPAQREREIARIAPYELRPPARCGTGRPQKGALMIHGILDTSFAGRDVGEALAAECMLVRGLLLPGHGTRAGDLRTVTKEEWIDAVNFGLRTLKADVDEVYVVGFSLGGLLATHAAVEHPDLAGAILIVPAVQLRAGLAADATTWLRGVRTWIDVLPNENPIKYQSFATNAAGEIAELKNTTNRAMKKRGITPPLYTLLAEHDLSVHSQKTLAVLQEFSSHEASRFIYYGARPEGIADDPRTEYRSASIPAEKVLNFSHLTFPYAPDNEIFGRRGRIKLCGQTHGLAPDVIAACNANPDPWKGEFGSTEDARYLPMQRLTYNPHFERMRLELRAFLNN